MSARINIVPIYNRGSVADNVVIPDLITSRRTLIIITEMSTIIIGAY